MSKCFKILGPEAFRFIGSTYFMLTLSCICIWVCEYQLDCWLWASFQLEDICIKIYLKYGNKMYMCYRAIKLPNILFFVFITFILTNATKLPLFLCKNIILQYTFYFWIFLSYANIRFVNFRIFMSWIFSPAEKDFFCEPTIHTIILSARISIIHFFFSFFLRFFLLMALFVPQSPVISKLAKFYFERIALMSVIWEKPSICRYLSIPVWKICS